MNDKSGGTPAWGEFQAGGSSADPYIGTVANGHMWSGSEWVPLQASGPSGTSPGSGRPRKEVSPKAVYGMAIAVGVVLVGSLAWAASVSREPALQAPTTEISSRTVYIDISGTARLADVLYQVGETQSQITDLTLPQRVATLEAHSGDFVYLSAQISSSDGGSITCKISLNGQVLVTNTSSGDFVIASCSGRVP
jgi:hypothetical protein